MASKLNLKQGMGFFLNLTLKLRMPHSETIARITILVATCLFAINAYTKVAANENLQVTEESFQELNKLFETHQIKTSPIPPEDLEKTYRAQTAAHRAHLSQVFLNISKDPEFLKKVPEFEMLAKDKKATVNALLAHDVSKSDPKAQWAIKVLARVRGYDWRNPPQGISPEAHEKISKIIKSAVGDINLLDDKAMEEKLRSLNRSPAWIEKHKQLTETLDYYDTWKSRQAEMADPSTGGRKLDKPSDWIKKLEDSGAYSPDELKKNELKKRFALYLEDKDPLENGKSFAKISDFAKATGPDFASKIDYQFERQGKLLLLKAGTLDRLSSAGAFVKGNLKSGAKGGLAVTALMAGAQYQMSPESFDGKSFINDSFADLPFSQTAGECSTVKCAEFRRNCQSTLKLPEMSLSRLLKQNGIEKCFENFLSQPLHLQSQYREDNTVDELFSNIVPRVVSLQCENSKNQIRFTSKQHKNFDQQVLTLSDQGSPQRLTRTSNETKDIVLFEGNEIFQHCKDNQCKTWELEKVKQQKLTAFVALDLPRDSFRWAKHNQKIAKGQSQQLKGCCHSNQCKAYFDQREQDLQRNAQAKSSQ